jgi:excisionase family DNA binding protein
MRDVLTPPSIGTRQSPTLTVGAAARITGYHPATIRRALLRGDLEGYRAGARGMYRIPAGALEDWLRPAHNPNEETP